MGIDLVTLILDVYNDHCDSAALSPTFKLELLHILHQNTSYTKISFQWIVNSLSKYQIEGVSMIVILLF